jgi:hypothetical protein
MSAPLIIYVATVVVTEILEIDKLRRIQGSTNTDFKNLIDMD